MMMWSEKFKHLKNAFMAFIYKKKQNAKDALGEEIEKNEPNFVINSDNNNYSKESFLGEKLSEIARGFWRDGFKDGRFAQNKKSINAIAENRARLVQYDITTEIVGEVAKLENAKELKKEVYEDSKNFYRDHKKTYDLLMEKFRNYPQAFSIFLGLLYLFVALSLIIADIPLALKLTQIGFDLDLGVVVIADLFERPIDTIKQNWEVFVLAIGIALSTIYIKIFFDEKIEQPLARHFTQFHELKKEGLADEEISQAKKINSKRNGVKTALLIFLLGTIFALGLFRFEAIEQQEKQKALVEEDADFGLYLDSLIMDDYSKNIEFPKNDNVIDESLRDESTLFDNPGDVNSERGNKSPYTKIITQLSFILITLLFPVVAGITSSKGLNYLHNYKNLFSTRRQLKKCSYLFHKTAKEYRMSRKAYEDKSQLLAWVEGRDFLLHTTNLFLDNYNHGYQRGLIVPLGDEYDDAMYERAVKIRGIIVKRKMYSDMQK